MRVLFFLVSLFLFACNDDQQDEQKPQKADPSHRMQIRFNPDAVNTNQPIQYTLTPIFDTSVSKLDIVHEKKIHLVVVSDDLGAFKHLHPEEQANGSFTLTDSFRLGGKYLLYADYKPAGGHPQITLKQIEVGGEPKLAESFTKADLEDEVSGYKVLLNPTGVQLQSGSEMTFTADILEGSKIIDPGSLQNYLGEKAHMVIISLADKRYLHVHPMVMGNKLSFHALFPAAGLYRVWLEFKKGDQVHVADFVVDVKAGAAKPATGGHDH